MNDVQITVNGKPVQEKEVIDWQTDRAYYIISKFKKLLGPEGLRALFAEENRKAEEKYLQAVKNSTPGVYKAAAVEMFVPDCTTADFLHVYFSGPGPELRESNPEHLLALPCGENASEIMEIMGCDDVPLRFKVCRDVKPEEFPFQPDPACTFCLRAITKSMEDQFLGAYAFHQFQDVEGGLRARLSIQFVDGVDDAIVEGQQKHLAIEFYNWLTRAAAVRKSGLTAKAD